MKTYEYLGEFFDTKEELLHTHPKVDWTCVRHHIKWSDGRCYRCGREVDPYDTGCPYCKVSFCD